MRKNKYLRINSQEWYQKINFLKKNIRMRLNHINLKGLNLKINNKWKKRLKRIDCKILNHKKIKFYRAKKTKSSKDKVVTMMKPKNLKKIMF